MNTPAQRTKPSMIRTVLVIEDEVLVRVTISQYLQDCGYRVLEAANADEAITILPDGHRTNRKRWTSLPSIQSNEARKGTFGLFAL